MSNIKYAELTEAKVDHPPESFVARSIGSQGYGRKIPVRYKVKIKGSNRWYRVYCCIFSNSGTLYVSTKQNDFLVVNEYKLQDLSK